MQWLGMDKNSNLSRAAMTKQNNVIEQGHQDDWRQDLLRRRLEQEGVAKFVKRLSLQRQLMVRHVLKLEKQRNQYYKTFSCVI